MNGFGTHPVALFCPLVKPSGPMQPLDTLILYSSSLCPRTHAHAHTLSSHQGALIMQGKEWTDVWAKLEGGVLQIFAGVGNGHRPPRPIPLLPPVIFSPLMEAPYHQLRLKQGAGCHQPFHRAPGLGVAMKAGLACEPKPDTTQTDHRWPQNRWPQMPAKLLCRV